MRIEARLVGGITSVRQPWPSDRGGSPWRNYVVDFVLTGLLRNGPPFLDAVTRMPELESFLNWNALWRLPLLWFRGAGLEPLRPITVSRLASREPNFQAG